MARLIQGSPPASGADWVARSQDRARVAVTEFRRPGDRDDSPAFLRAIADGRRLYVPAGRGMAADGAYLVGADLNSGNLGTSALIEGDGVGRSVIRHAGSSYIFHCDSGSADTGRNLREIILRDLTLEDNVAEAGFSEHRHLVHINGVTSVLFERVLFRGFCGDGLYLGSGAVAGTERHNRDIIVRDCAFDGVNKDNRNAISVIDGDGVSIDRCAFRNCSRLDMPGAVDIEPDANSFAIIRNIRVTNCTFDNVGGGLAQINLFIPQAAPMPTDIVLSDNVFRNYSGRGNAISLNVNRTLAEGDAGMNVTISGNRGSGGHGVYGLISAKQVHAFDNEWSDYTGGVLIGYVEPGNFVRDVTIRDRFERCASGGGAVINIFNVASAFLDGSQFVDCGGKTAPSSAILFSRGASQRVSVRGIRIAGLRGPGAQAIGVAPDHRLNRASNFQQGNDYGGYPAASIIVR